MVVQERLQPHQNLHTFKGAGCPTGAHSVKALGKASWEALTELLKFHLNHYFSSSWFLLRNSCSNKHMVILVSTKLNKKAAQKQFIPPPEVCHGEAE